MGLDRLGDAIKDIWDFERSNLKGMFDKIKDDPKRLLSPVPMVDPVGTKIGSGLGFGEKDASPLVNQWGGATEESYAAAEAQGIDTGPGRFMHDVAQSIAASYAGGYGAEQAAGAMPAMPEIPTGWQENVPESVRGFLPGGAGGGPVLTPEQAGMAGQIFSGAAMGGHLYDEAEERSDPGPWPLPEGTYVPGDISPNYQSFMDKYSGTPGGTTPVGNQPSGAPPGGGSYGSFMERYGGGRMPETRHQPGRPGTPVGAPSPAFSYNPTPPVGWA